MLKLQQFDNGNLNKNQENGRIIKYNKRKKIKLWKSKDSKKSKNNKKLRSGKNKKP